MKSIFKMIAVVAASGLTMVAYAGEQSSFYSQGIYASDGFLGSSYISASSYCGMDPDGTGGTNAYGTTEIDGYIAGNYVNVIESYDTLDSCPEIFDNVDGGKNQTVKISVGGVVVTAACSKQGASNGSEISHTRYPGEKPQSYSEHWKQQWTTDNYDMSCVITATDAGGNTETFFGTIATATTYNSILKWNTG